MLNCEQASSLSSQRLDRDLTLRETIAWNMHVLVCRLCKEYAKQLGFLRQAGKRLDTHDQAAEGLNDEAKERMRERLKHP